MSGFTWHNFAEFIKQSLTLTGKYIIGRLLASFVMGIVSFFFFYLLDFNLPLVMAIIIAAFNLVPIIGPIAATVWALW